MAGELVAIDYNGHLRWSIQMPNIPISSEYLNFDEMSNKIVPTLDGRLVWLHKSEYQVNA